MPNPFALSEINAAGAPPAPANSNPFTAENIRAAVDGHIGGQRSELAMQARYTMVSAIDSKPDYEAELQAVAKRSGVLVEVVRSFPDEMKNRAALERFDFDSMAAEFPNTTRFLADQDKARISHDDVENLTGIERAIRGQGNTTDRIGPIQGPKPSIGSVLGGLATTVPASFDQMRLGVSMMIDDALGFKSDARTKFMRAQNRIQDATPEFESSTAKGVFSGVQSTIQAVPGVAAAVVGGLPAGLAVAGLQVQTQAYGKYRARGGTAGEAALGSIGEGAVEVAAEMLPMGFMVNKLGKVGFNEFFKGMLAREIPGEQLATLAQDALDTAIANPNKTWGEYIAERPDAAYQTLLATVVQGGVMGGINTIAKKISGNDAQAARAEQGAVQLQAQIQLANGALLRRRNPDEFRTLVQSMADSTDGAPKEVFIDAEVLNQLAPEVLAQFPGIAAQMEAALAANDVVSIPMGEVLTVAPGTPLEQMLVENARIGSPAALSQAEAKAAGEQALTYLAEESGRVIAQASEQQAVQESSNRVRQGVLDQLNTVGRFRQDVNEGYATWTAAFYTTMAGRQGVSPEEMAAKYPLSIVGQGAANAGTLNQAEAAERQEAAAQPDESAQIEEPAQGVLNQGPRATFNPAGLQIALNENANMSSFLHETGHFFLEVMADLSSQPGAPADVQADMGVLLKWFGVADLDAWRAMRLDQQRPYHERFAESVEQYLMEGKAPSLALQPLFRKFRAWLLNVYKSAKAFTSSRQGATEIQLSDEVRQVFDRMLASEEQIAQAEEVAGLLPNEEATTEAIEKLSARSLRDLKWTINARSKALKALQKEAAGLRKEVEEEVTAEVDAMPEFRAKKALDALQVDPDHTVTAKLWKEQRTAALETAREAGKAQLLADNPDVKGLAKGQLLTKNKRAIENQAEAQALQWEAQNPKPRKLENASELDMATVADSFGYPDIDTMLQAIDAVGKKADAIEHLTDQRMLERHGDLTSPQAMEAAANEAVHNEARARSLASELRSQAEALNVRTDTGQVNARGSKITVNSIMEAAKQFAANIVASTPLKDLKTKAAQHAAAEARAGKRWGLATAKGQTQEAINAKHDQVLNNATAKAAIDAQAELREVLAFFKLVLGGSNATMVEKGRDPDVVNAARAVLGAYGAAPRSAKTAAEYMDIVARQDPAMFAVLQPSVQGALDMAQPLEALTMEELRGLHEGIQSMWHLAKRSRQMEVDGNLMDIEDAEEELQGRMKAVGIPASMPGDTGAITPREKFARVLQHVGSLMRRAEQWAEGMDGRYGGPFLRLVFQPVKEAANRYRTDRVIYRKKYQALVDAVAPALTKGLIAAPELGYTFGKGHNGIGHAELLHAILHTGNAGNKRKLLLGRGWATQNEDGTLDTGKWDAFLLRMHDTGILTGAHYDFAQGVWDLLDETKPLAQKTHRDVYGRYFAEVTADAFETPFGEYAGGYVPAQADPRLVQDAAMRKLAETENENMAFSFPSTSKGFTKGRVEYNRPLMLDLRTIGQHLDKVLLFAHMEPAVRDVNKLLRREEVSRSLGRIDPTIYEGMLIPWLNRSARQIVETPVAGDGGISRVLSAARSRAGMALMMANVSNTLQQVTGFASAMAKFKADGLQSHMMRAAAQFIAHPKDMARAVSGASIFMADRMGNEIAAINNVMDEILLNPSVYDKANNWTQKHAYFLQTAMANTMEPIIWTAAYNASLARNGDEKTALRYADGVIRQTQGSTLPEDVSRIETGPAYARAFTQFIGWANMVANTNATALKQIAQEVGIKEGAGKALGIVTMGFLIPAWVAEAIAVAMRGGPDDKDDDGYLLDWLTAVFVKGTIKSTLGMVPFAGQLANAGINRFNGNPADDRVSMSPAVSLLEAGVGVPVILYKAIADPDKLNARNAVRDVASAVSIAVNPAAYAAARPLGYLAGVADGRIEPTGQVDAIRGLVTGTASPGSK